MEEYNKLVQEEDVLCRRIDTCEEAARAISSWLYKNPEKLDEYVLEEVTESIAELQHGYHIELLLLRLKKARLSSLMKDSH